MNLLKTTLLVNFALFVNQGHALVMPASGASLIIDKSETLYVSDGDIFDLSSIDIRSGGSLDVYENTSNAAFSIISASDFIVNGNLNLYVSKTSLVSDSFYISGSVFVQQGGEVSFTAPYITLTNTAKITVENGSISLNTPPNEGSPGVVIIKDAGSLNPKPIITVSTVPEPENYALFLAGLGLIGAVRRRQLV